MNSQQAYLDELERNPFLREFVRQEQEEEEDIFGLVADGYDQYERMPPPVLIDALERDVSVEELRQLIGNLTQEQVDQADDSGKNAAHFAIHKNAEVCRVVLDAMSKEGLSKISYFAGDPLHAALITGRKEAVLMLAERQEREEGLDIFGSTKGPATKLGAFLMGPLINDKEVLEVIDRLVPDSVFLGVSDSVNMSCSHNLSVALESSHGRAPGAVEMCLRRGHPIEKLAAESRDGGMELLRGAVVREDVSLVRRFYEAMPLQKNGERRPAKDFAFVIHAAAGNREHCVPILEYFESVGVLDPSSSSSYYSDTLTHFATVEQLEWFLSRMPDLLIDACEEEESTFLTHICSASPDVAEYLIDQILEIVEPETISNMLIEVGVGPDHIGVTRAFCPDGWMWKVERLFAAVPSVLEKYRWEALMDSINEKFYKDVEFLLPLCTKEDLSKRNSAGNRAADLAAKDGDFPLDLLPRLVVATKNANC